MNGYDFLCEYYETLDNRFLYPISYSFVDVCLYPISFCILTDEQLRAIFSYFAWEQHNAMISGDLIWAEKLGEKIASLLEMVMSEGADKFVMPLDFYTVEKYGKELNFLDLLFSNKEHPVIKSNVLEMLSKFHRNLSNVFFEKIQNSLLIYEDQEDYIIDENDNRILLQFRGAPGSLVTVEKSPRILSDEFFEKVKNALLIYDGQDDYIIDEHGHKILLQVRGNPGSLITLQKLKNISKFQYEAGIKLKDVVSFDVMFAHRMDMRGLISKMEQHGFKLALEGTVFEYKEFIPLKLVEMLISHQASKTAYGAIKSEHITGFRMTYGNVLMKALVGLFKDIQPVLCFEDMANFLAEVNTPQIYLSEFIQSKGPQNEIQMSEGLFPSEYQHLGSLIDNIVVPIIDNKTLVISEMNAVEYMKKNIEVSAFLTAENLIRQIYFQGILNTVEVSPKTISQMENLITSESVDTIVNILHDGDFMLSKLEIDGHIAESIVQLYKSITQALTPNNMFGASSKETYALIMDSVESALDTFKPERETSIQEYYELSERIQKEIRTMKDMTTVSAKGKLEGYVHMDESGFQKTTSKEVTYTPDVEWYYKVGGKEILIEDKYTVIDSIYKEATLNKPVGFAHKFIGKNISKTPELTIVFKYGSKFFRRTQDREVLVDGKFEKDVELMVKKPLIDKLARSGRITSDHVLVERDGKHVILDNLFILISRDFVESLVSKEPGWMENGYKDLYESWSHTPLVVQTEKEVTVPHSEYYGYTKETSFDTTLSFLEWAEAKLEKNIYIPDEPYWSKKIITKKATITAPPMWFDEKEPLLAYIEYSGFIRTIRREIDVILESRHSLSERLNKEFTDQGHFFLVDRAILKEMHTDDVSWYEKEVREFKEAVDNPGPQYYDKMEKFVTTLYSKVGWSHRLMRTILIDTAFGVFDKLMLWYQKFLPWIFTHRMMKPTTLQYVRPILVDKTYRPMTSVSYHVLMEAVGRNVITPETEKWFEKLGRNTYIEELVLTVSKDPRGILVIELVVLGDREPAKVTLGEFDGQFEHIDHIVNILEEQIKIIKNREIIISGQVDWWTKQKDIKIFEKLLIDKVERAIIELLGPEYGVKEKLVYLAENFVVDGKLAKEFTPLIGYSLLEMYQRWHFMPSDGPWDKMILPADYPYVSLPIMGVNEHPLPWGGDKALTEIKVSILIMANVIDFCRELWYANLRLYTRYTPSQAIKHFVKNIYDWLTKYTPETGWKPPEFYFEDYGYYNTNKIVLEDYWRLYRWIRWYAEGIIMNVHIADKNDINMGNTYVRRLIDDLIKYFNDHHGNYQLPSQKNINKHKGQRHLFIKGDESYGNEF